MNVRSFACIASLCASAALEAGAPPGFERDPQQLLNGGFEEGEDAWNFWGAGLASQARMGKAAVRIANSAPKWSGADQIVQFPAATRTAKVSGWIRTKDVVAGRNPWEMGRIAVEFVDDAGTLVGGYPPVVIQLSGTTEWVEGTREYPVPRGATRMKVQCALGNATGEVLCDDLSVSLRDSSGGALQATKATGPLDFGRWWDLPAQTTGSHFVDWSGLLDAPAGKHGWVNPKGDRLVFDDGVAVRFWGTSLVGSECFPSRAAADSLAKRLSRMGANLVRLHHMDAPWSRPNLFGNASGTRKLDSSALDKVDYLISALKRRGIYAMPDLLVHRQFTADDGIPEGSTLGAKQVAIFSPRLIRLQREFARDLLNHRNPHTGLAWKDDPAIALTECINESSIFAHFDPDQIGPTYRRELDSLWKAAGNTGELSSYELDWSNPRGILKASTGSNHLASFRFLAGLERAYYDSIRSTIRQTGGRLMVAGTNFPPPILATLRNQLATDLVISNDYWDHPQVWKIGNDWNRVDWAPLDNRSQLRNPSSNLVATKSWFAVQGKPLLVTEWNHCFPNEYEVEGVPLMAAYGALQGWSGILQFDFENVGAGADRISRYKVSRSPTMLAQWVAGAPLFLRGDVSMAKDSVVESVDSVQVETLPSYSGFLQERWALPYAAKVRKRFSGPASGEPDRWDRKGLRDTGKVASSTRELELDPRAGTLAIRTSRSQGAVGAVGGREWTFQRISFRLDNPVASILAVSADGAPLESSRRMYLVTTGPSRMKGQRFTASRTGIKELGELPVQTQVLQGTIRILGAGATKATVRALDGNGNAGAPLKLESVSGGVAFDPSRSPALVYEILIPEGSK
ncbi:MAG TPA: hypothetical protein PKO15_00665 [Fibrobacteria bacterium]|nr:hypothetical protein [Fibrobacteria bacterium]